MQRVALINWENINQDYDLAKIIKSIVTNWVVEWLEILDWKVTPWYAFVNITRDQESFPIIFANTEDLIIDTTWTKKVFIEINQENIDDWSINNANWTWIWEIKIWASYPSENFLSLASISSWVITDERVFINFRWYKRKGLNINKVLYVDENWYEVELAYDTTIDEWKAIVISSTWLTLQSPSVNIVWLIEKINPVWNDLIVLSDSEDENSNKKTKLSSIIDFAKQNFFDKPVLYTWSWWEWNLIISSWTTSLNPNTIYEYNNVTISWWTLTTNWLTDNGSLLILLVSWTFKMTWWIINMNWLWGSWNKLEDMQAQVWYWRSYKDARWSTNWRQDWFPVSVWTYKQLFENVTCWSWWSWANDWYWWQYIMRWGRWGWWVIIIANKIEFTWWTINANWLNWTSDSTSYWAWGPWGWAWGCVFLYSLNKANVDFDNVIITATWWNWISGQIRYWYSNGYSWWGWWSNCNMGWRWWSTWWTNLPSQAWNNWTNGKWFWVALTGWIWWNWWAWLNPQSWYTAPGWWWGWAWWDFYFYL